MADVLDQRVVKDVATLKAVADPVRLTVLEVAMTEPARVWTAKEFAAAVGIPPTKIYYHLNLLEQHALLQIRNTRVVNGIIEKQYGAGQRNLTFHRRSSATGADSESGSVGEVATNLLRQARDEIAHGLTAGWISASPDAVDGERMLLSRAVADIPEQRLGEFREELLALVRRFEEAGATGGRRFAMLVAMHPREPAETTRGRRRTRSGTAG